MSKQNKIFANKKAVSLIEIILSISVLSVGILGLLQAFPRGISAQKAIELKTVANHLAQGKIEELSSLGYENIPTGTIENQTRADLDQQSPFYNFLRTTEVELVEPGLKKITATIEWKRPLDGSFDSATIITLISQR